MDTDLKTLCDSLEGELDWLQYKWSEYQEIFGGEPSRRDVLKFSDIGKPEPLKNALAGCWSRRIDQEHRLVYQVLDAKICILACRFHY